MPPALSPLRLADGKEPESVRPTAERNGALPPVDLRRALARLEGLPLRPLTARAALEASARPEAEPGSGPSAPKFLRTDPGWVLGLAHDGGGSEPMGRVASQPWWRPASEVADAALERLWKHAVAAESAARRLATEAGRPDVEAIARAALLHQLGLWAVAAVAPDRLAEILALASPRERREQERALLGKDSAALGRDLAERWGSGALVADAAWLHADGPGDLGPCSDDPGALLLVQEAYQLAERTPWHLCDSPRLTPGPTEPRVRILMAEVQVRCAGGLLELGATQQEEAISRAHARLILENRRLAQEVAARDRLLAAIADHDPTDTPEAWAERASLAWCQGPGVTSARVEWTDASGKEKIVRLDHPNRPAATLALRSESPGSGLDPATLPTVAAWGAFAELVADRDRQVKRLDAAVAAHRDRVDRAATADRAARLDALAEFAAGAGHELNNPLAVILGRAQLLLPLVADPKATRSLRIIIGQAQRAHRILRDLMYVARPPADRPRPCQPDEIIRSCLRDFQDEAEARGVRLVAEVAEPVPVALADPDPLRHLADLLVRNALEATPSGGTVRVETGKRGDRLCWTIKDTGVGIGASEGAHLFEPFYCGRQAGRGLGLGLPRAARFVSRAGGELSWKSAAGAGTSFSLTLPIDLP